MVIGRRRLVRLAGATGLAGLIGRERGAARAQEATPPSKASARLLASASPLSDPDQTMTLFRFSVPPGYTFSPHHHSGLSLTCIEQGKLVWTLLEGSAEYRRAGDGRRRQIAVGETVTLEPGDGLAYDRETSHSAAADPDEGCIALSVTLFPAGQPDTIPFEG